MAGLKGDRKPVQAKLIKKRSRDQGGKYVDPHIGNLSERWQKRRWFREHMDRFLVFYKGNGCNTFTAARAIGANSSVIRSWREEMPWFRQEMDEILDEVFGDAQETVFKKRKTLSGAQWLLLSHAKGHEMGYGRRLNISERKDLTLTMRMEVEQMKRMYTREELEQLQQLLNKASGSAGDGGFGEEDGEDASADAGGFSVGGKVLKPLH